jgi:hypothetical protein
MTLDIMFYLLFCQMLQTSNSYIKCHYAESRSAECHYAESHSDECHNAEGRVISYSTK